jgi:hypothetical protein
MLDAIFTRSSCANPLKLQWLVLAMLSFAPLLAASQTATEPTAPVPAEITAEASEENQIVEPSTELQQMSYGTAPAWSPVWDCFDIKTPYGLTFADGSELTVEWGLEELQDKMQAGHPGRIPNGFVFPLTIDYIDGTSELISSQETMEARINSCNNE